MNDLGFFLSGCYMWDTGEGFGRHDTPCTENGSGRWGGPQI